MLKKINYLAILTALILASCAQPNRQKAQNIESKVQTAKKSERLGTQWGDEVSSRVRLVKLRRASKEPIAKTQVLYADKAYQGRQINSIALAAGKVALAIETDRRKLPMYRDAGNYYLSGKAGQPYRLVYRNNSRNTYEIVASVDGIDVLNGKPASQYNRGYVLRPKGKLIIEGFRKSKSAVASFIFSKPSDAYVANTRKAKLANNTGIIGTVIYPLYDPNKTKPKQDGLQAFPADKETDTGYAQPPQ